MKTYITVFAFFLSVCLSQAQETQYTSSVKVSIDWEDQQNEHHKYKNIFQSKDKDFIKWIYETSKNVAELTANGEDEKHYYNDKKGNDTINFMVNENNEIRKESYRNAVKPSKRNKSNSSIFLPKYSKPRIEGHLPEGITTYFSDSSKGIEIGIKIDNVKRKVKIEILNTEHEIVHIIEDESLTEGWHNYKWDTNDIKPDVYILKYNVDESEMTQTINIESGNGTLLGRFIDWLF